MGMLQYLAQRRRSVSIHLSLSVDGVLVLQVADLGRVGLAKMVAKWGYDTFDIDGWCVAAFLHDAA